MKVLHLEAGKHLYGGALQVLLLVEGLQRQGVDNLLVVPEGSDVASEAEVRELPLHTLPMTGEADLRFPGRFKKLIETHSPDLVHLHSRRGADLLGGLGARWAGVPVVMTRRVDNPEVSWAVGAKYRLFDRVITISHAITRVLLDQGVEKTKLRCVHSALDPAPFENPCPEQGFPEELGLNSEGPVVGMAAQFIPRKGHHILLEAVPSILDRHPGTRFLLLGRGPLETAVGEAVRASGLQDAVRLPGFRDDLSTLLPCLDLLVHPATMEGLGVILLQAGASGIPVVASEVGGIPEAVIHEKTGLLVPPGNPAVLAEAVCELLADPHRAQTLGEAGRKHIRTQFSIDRMVQGNLEVYQELLPPPSN
jgi:glycosyltransferase involved in cell wall biosynthesis